MTVFNLLEGNYRIMDARRKDQVLDFIVPLLFAWFAIWGLVNAQRELQLGDGLSPIVIIIGVASLLSLLFGGALFKLSWE
jgi:amino acid permease